MPYSGAGDPNLPDNVKSLPVKKRRQWVSVFNSTFERCMGGETRVENPDTSKCESFAFQNANGVVKVGKAGEKSHMNFTIYRLEEVTRKKHNGKDYLLAPVVAVQEQVLNGEFAPADEISAYIDAWNGIPLMLGHPIIQGEPASANDPDLIAKMGMGRFYNADFEEGKLHGEAWFDIAKVEAMGGSALETLKRIENGVPTDVSTAYYRDFEELPGTFGDMSYEVVQRNLRPDHLAVLVGEEGACSWSDGCGIPRANCASECPNRQTTEVNMEVKDVLDDPTFTEKIKTMWDEWVTNFRKETGMDKKKDDLIGKIVKHEKFDQSPIQNEEVFEVMEFDDLEEFLKFLEGLDEEPVEDPKINAIIEKIVAHEKSPIKDEKVLKAMSLEELEKLYSNLEEDPGESDPDEFDPKASHEELKELIEGVAGEVKELKANQEKDDDEAKAEIIEELVANEGTAFSEDELKELPLETLQKFAQSLLPADYSGRRMIYQRASGEEEIPAPPAIVLAKVEPAKNGK